MQEVAFTFANAIAYLDAARTAGLDLHRLGQRISFFFAAHNDFIEEIGKFRAARRLWAHIMRDRFGVTDPRAQQLRFHTQTGGVTLTAQQPDNNIVRVAIQALAAVLGGTQSLHSNGRDEALALPTEEAARIALRTQQIIASESGVANTVDPLGGSWALEKGTDEIEAEALALIEGNRQGGRNAGGDRIGQNPAPDPGRRLCRPAGRRLEARRSSSASIGMQTGEPSSVELLQIDPESEQRQADGVRKCVQSRDSTGLAGHTLDAVERSARDGTNLVPPIIAAVEARATLGEIADTLRGVFGEHREIQHLTSPPPPRRAPPHGVPPRRTGAKHTAVDDVSFDDPAEAKRSGWSANPAAASPSPPSLSSGSSCRPDESPGAASSSTAKASWTSTRRRCASVRGRRIGFVFQEPMVALDPPLHDWLPDRGDARRARARPWRRRARPRDRSARGRPRARSRQTRARVSSSAQRRPSTARDDRVGAFALNRHCSSPTSRRRRSTSPCRRRSSTCSSELRRKFSPLASLDHPRSWRHRPHSPIASP